MNKKYKYIKIYKNKTEHIGNRTQVLGPEIPCTTTMLYALAVNHISSCLKLEFHPQLLTEQ